MRSHGLLGLLAACGLLAVAAGAQTTAMSDAQGSSQAGGAVGHQDSGKQVYERANCVGCHKWSGVGGGGYGGAALSLRASHLTHDEIMQVVTCGRPGTGMPHFTADPYRDRGCYGLSGEDVKDMMPPNANLLLRPQEIDEVASYVVSTIEGKGDPGLTDCQAFFGSTSRVCDVYRPQADAAGGTHHAMPTPTTTAR